MKKINIAFVGLGFVSQISHLPNFFYNKKVNLVAICDKNKKILKLLGQKYQTNNIFENIDDLLNSDIKIDLIILSVNREAVYNCSKKILEKKINLFTEKPPSLTYDQFISLLNISKKNKLRYLVGYMRRYEDSVNFIKKKLVNKKIVSLTVENFNGDSYFNPINYYRVNYLSKPKKNSYYNYLNSHSHDINLIRYFMGDIKLIYKEFNKKGEGLALFKNKIKVNIFFTNRYLKSTNWHQIYKFDLGNQIITLELPPPFLINASSILKVTDLKNGSNFKKKLKGIWSFKRESQIIVNDIINNKKNRTEASTCLADLKIIENLFNN